MKGCAGRITKTGYGAMEESEGAAVFSAMKLWLETDSDRLSCSDSQRRSPVIVLRLRPTFPLQTPKSNIG